MEKQNIKFTLWDKTVLFVLILILLPSLLGVFESTESAKLGVNIAIVALVIYGIVKYIKKWRQSKFVKHE